MNIWQKVAEAAERGDLEYLKDARTYRYIDFTLNTEALFRAVNNNHLECVAFLLPLSNLTVERGETVNGSSGQLLQTAAHNSNFDMVELLLPHCNPKLNKSLALQYASVNGHQEIFNLLYPHSDAVEALEDLTQRVNAGIWQASSADLLYSRMQRDAIASLISAPERALIRKI